MPNETHPRKPVPITLASEKTAAMDPHPTINNDDDQEIKAVSSVIFTVPDKSTTTRLAKKPKDKTSGKIMNFLKSRPDPQHQAPSLIQAPAGEECGLHAQNDKLRGENGQLFRRLEYADRDYLKLEEEHRLLDSKFVVLKAEHSKLQEDIKTLEEGQSGIIRKNSDLKNGHAAMQAQFMEYKQAHSRSLTDAQNAQSTIASMQRELEQARLHVGEASTTIGSLRDDNNRIKDQSRKIAAELAELENHLAVNSGFADDEFFLTQWNNLQSMIIDWAQNNFRGEPLSQNTEQESLPRDRRHFRCLARDPKLYTELDYERPYFVQSFIWSVLVDNVFVHPGRDGRKDLFGLLWADSKRDELESLSSFLYPVGSANKAPNTFWQKYMTWRALTSQLLVEKINGDLDRDRDVQVYPSLLKDLGTYTFKYLEPLRCSNDKIGCQNSMRAIFAAAIKLDAKMNQQRARLILKNRWIEEGDRQWGFLFDPTIMSDTDQNVSPSQRATVQLVLTPALVRYGTMGGEDYKTPVVLAKALVHLDPVSVSRDTVMENETEENVGDGREGFRGRTKKAWRKLQM